MLGATIRNSFSMVVLRPGFVRRWLCVYVVQAFITYCRQTQTIQTSYSRNLVGLHNNVAYLSRICYLLSAVQYFGSDNVVAISLQADTLAGIPRSFFTQNIIKVQDSNGVPANQGLEKIRASFKS